MLDEFEPWEIILLILCLIIAVPPTVFFYCGQLVILVRLLCR